VSQHRTTPSSILPVKITILGQEVLKIHANINNHISALNVRETPKFPHLAGNRSPRLWKLQRQNYILQIKVTGNNKISNRSLG